MVFVFSGTSEGRELSEKLATAGIACRVFVATEYGEAVMKDSPNICVSVGRLNVEEIAELINGVAPNYVLDATHPHATLITENIKKACCISKAEDKYIRVSRGMKLSDDEYADSIIRVLSAGEAASALKEFDDGKIMLTTGVKELESFCLDTIKDRLIVRILPGKESIEMAYECGLTTKQVVAMEGPFSKDMNAALIRNYDVRVLVTKNSGSRGGYLEKIKACSECGIKAIVIEKTEESDGISIDEAVSKVVLGNKLDSKIILPDESVGDGKTIALIGTGVCNAEYLIPAAKSFIDEAQVIIGAKRMTEFGRSINPNASFFNEYKAEKVLDIIRSSNERKIAILLSGDTGLCSGAKAIKDIIESELTNADLKLIPGISSVSYFASKIGIQYSDYAFVSLHAGEIDYMRYVSEGEGFFAICSGLSDVVKVADSVKDMNVTLYAGKNLGSKDEVIIIVDKKEKAEKLGEGLYVIAVIKSDRIEKE